ncbi:glycosyltransferase family 2 protein, partial [Vibrio sp. Isolate31]|uniref:glycosyltransferase family 2 protein n=1 Tax=Vibrio sp. Isolate31 TaxID=2908537 RepID=UPI001EFE97D7|nr:glycosyltransferase family 2 protein [Vibrio sp. Isolate31]
MLISILIPAYNAQFSIETTIDSILSQTKKRYEIIIIDDGSTDDTFIKLKKYKNLNNVKVFSRENIGVNKTRKELLDLAEGDYVLFMDADDELYDIHVLDN